MAQPAASVNFDDRIEALREQTGGSVSVDDIAATVTSLINSMAGNDQMDLAQISTELHGMLDSISRARDELTAMKPRALSEKDIPVATDELDAVVQHTEEAAGRIMDAADRIVEISGELEGETAEALMEVSTSIFEASSFQDITGQRVNKVVGILQHIEGRLKSLADAIGDTYVPEDQPAAKEESKDEIDEASLQNGPQLDGQGNNQDDIDALLASFD